ncbi:MAG: hypothetical protein J7K88_01225 [Candidatus Fermentibacteraceae bacterium]|nr:hypothetical protein [Candidatus Fermentibacteraceae bacterium]
MARKGKFKQLLPVLLPILLPVALLLTYLVRESLGQLNDPVQILASIDPSGDGTAYLSTILPDGAQAVWTCSSGEFTSTSSTEAYGRSVTWQAAPGYLDSVTVVVVTPSATDTVRFLPVILEVTPTITVSSAYHLAILERSRFLSLPAGSYTIIVEGDNLQNYDGLTILIGHFPGSVRDAWTLFPGDTMSIDLPLGAEFEAVGLDNLEGALDNVGSVFIRFIRDESASAVAVDTVPELIEEPETPAVEEDSLSPVVETDSIAVDSVPAVEIELPPAIETTVETPEDSVSFGVDSLPPDTTSI